MASFKLNIADPKDGKCYKTEAKDAQASPFVGMNIGEKIDGGKIGLDGYELEITGGSDYCGFPMRGGILGIRKKLVIYKGIGFKGGVKGMKKRKTICGHKINEKISAINLKVAKEGSRKLSEIFPSAKEGQEAKEEPKKETKPEAKEQKSEEKAKQEAKEQPKKEAKQE